MDQIYNQIYNQKIAAIEVNSFVEVDVVRNDLTSTFGMRFTVPNDPSTTPMVVTAVNPGSPAALAGLQIGTSILTINGIFIKNLDHSQLMFNIGQSLSCQSIRVTVLVKPPTNTTTNDHDKENNNDGENRLLAEEYDDILSQVQIEKNARVQSLESQHSSNNNNNNNNSNNNSVDPISSDDSHGRKTRSIALERDSFATSFGLCFSGKPNTPGVFISRIIPGSIASKNSFLVPGLMVLGVNGHTTHLLDVAAVQRLAFCVGHSLSLLVGPISPGFNEFESNGHTLGLLGGLTKVLIKKNLDEQSFGLTFGGPLTHAVVKQSTTGVFIAGTEPNSAATRTELVPIGHQIITLNGVDVKGFTLEDITKLFEESPQTDTLELYTMSNLDLLACYTHIESRTINLKRRKGAGFGFFLSAVDDSNLEEFAGVVISGVKRGGLAARAGGLMVGWQLMEMNGVNLSKGTMVEARSVLKSVTSDLSMTLKPNRKLTEECCIKHPEYPWPFYSGQLTVVVERDDDKEEFGLVFLGAESREEAKIYGCGVAIGPCEPNSPAFNCGTLPSKWQIGRINGVDMSDAIRKDAEEVVKETEGNSLTIVLINTALIYSVYTRLKHYNEGIELKEQNKTHTPDSRGDDEDVENVLLPDDDDLPDGSNGTNGTIEFGNATSTATAMSLSSFASLTTVAQDVDPTVIVKLDKGKNGFGLTFEGARSDEEGRLFGFGIFLKGVAPGSTASQRGDIPIGWQLVSVNGTNLEDGTFFELKQAMFSVTDHMALELRENTVLMASYTRVRAGRKVQELTTRITTSITKGVGGFGMIFGGPKSQEEADIYGYGVFIKSCKPGSVAEAHPDVRAGLQVTKMNGVDLTNSTINGTLKDTVKKSGDTLLIEVCENKLLTATYIELVKQKVAAKDRSQREEITTLAKVNESFDEDTFIQIKRLQTTDNA